MTGCVYTPSLSEERPRATTRRLSEYAYLRGEQVSREHEMNGHEHSVDDLDIMYNGRRLMSDVASEADGCSRPMSASSGLGRTQSRSRPTSANTEGNLERSASHSSDLSVARFRSGHSFSSDVSYDVWKPIATSRVEAQKVAAKSQAEKSQAAAAVVKE